MFKKWGGVIFATTIMLAGCGSDQTEDVIPSHIDYEEDDYQRIVEPNNELAFQLLNKVEPDEDANLFISPTSLFMALSMLYNGAEGETKDDIARTLKTEEVNKEILNQANASLISKLNEPSASQLELANSIWVNDDYALNETFQTKTEDHFNAEVEAFDIGDTDSPKRMNQWVEEATNDRITDIVDSPLDDELAAILIHAIYFKGNWKYEFDNELTEEHPFHLQEGKTTDVPFMKHEEKEFNYMENEHVQAIELPYSEDEMSMHVILPKEVYSLEALKKSLTYEKWTDWIENFEETEGTLLLPKFELDVDMNLNETLSELGMEKAFDGEQANFSQLIQGDESLVIDKVKQKSFINVDEEGTEAAAATSVEMKTVSVNLDAFQMVVNRPFVLTITDNETGTILFMGAIADPPEAPSK